MSDLLLQRRALVDGVLRWRLERIWDDRLPGICYCGTNPSKADDEIDDMTALRWMHFARAWGFGWYIAVNQYPFRSASPAECRAWLRQLETDVGEWNRVMQRNLNEIERAAQETTMFVACWGNAVWDTPWADQIVETVINATGRPVHCFGTTKDGLPKHPMARGIHRVTDDQQPIVWATA